MLLKMDRLYSLIGLAFRANKLLYGIKAMEAIEKKKVHLVILSNEASEKTRKKVLDKCAAYQVSVKYVDSKDDLSKAIGKENIVRVAIIDLGFTQSILKA